MNNGLSSVYFLCAVCLAAPGLGYCADSFIEEGDDELEFSGAAFQSSSSSPFGSYKTRVAHVSLRYGHFITRNFEFGALGSLIWQKDDTDSFTYWSGGPFFDLNFPAPGSRVVPVIGVAWQTLQGTDLSGQAYDASLGIRVFASDDVSVNIRGFYSKSSTKYDPDNFPAYKDDRKDYGVRFGLSWFIR